MYIIYTQNIGTGVIFRELNSKGVTTNYLERLVKK